MSDTKQALIERYIKIRKEHDKLEEKLKNTRIKKS